MGKIQAEALEGSKTPESKQRTIPFCEQIIGNVIISILFGLSLMSTIIYTWFQFKVPIDLGIHVLFGMIVTGFFVTFSYVGIICYQNIREGKWINEIMSVVQPIYLVVGLINALLFTLHCDQLNIFLEPENLIKMFFLLIMGILAFGFKIIFNFRNHKTEIFKTKIGD